MRMPPTRKGLAFLTTTLILMLLGYSSKDVVILYGSLALLLIPVTDYLYLATARRKRCYCEVERGEHVLYVWERKTFKLIARCAGFSSLGGLPNWLKVIDTSANGEMTTVKLEAFFNHHGTFRLTELSINRRFLGFFELVEKANIGVTFKVYPEAAYWVVKAVNLLGLQEGAMGEVSPPSAEVVNKILAVTRTRTGDYVGSREYTPGDAVSRVDWKATARLQSLYVKEFGGDGDSGLTVIFDDACFGPYTCDRIASLLLSLILNPVVRNTYTLKLIDASTGKAVDSKSWTDLVLYSLKKVFELKVIEPEALCEYVEPTTAAELAMVIGKTNYELKDIKYSPRTDHHIAISVLSGSGNESAILEHAETLRNNLTVLTPSRPWLDFSDLGHRYSVYMSLEHTISKLRKLGCRIFMYDIRRSGAGR